MVKRVEVIANPKAATLLHSSVPSTSSIAPAQTNAAGGGGGNSNNNAAQGQQIAPSSSSSSTPSSPASSSSSSQIIVESPSTTPISPNIKQNSSSSKSTTLGASIGGTLGALALLSLAVVLIRRRQKNSSSRQFSSLMTPEMISNSTFQAGGTVGGAPLVSSLMYTRPVQQRRLSLGSTISEVQSENGTIRAGNRGNPFGDEYGVNELGQLATSPSPSTPATGSTTGKNKGSSLLQRSKSSVTSIPFLSTITRDFSPSVSSSISPNPAATSTADVYTTLPAPTHSDRRRSSNRRSLLPMPQTPAELIGLAVTSDDGHDGVAYRSNGNEKVNGGGEGWEKGFLNSVSIPSSQLREEPTGAGVNGGGGIPAVLRPATPLRVRNAD
ncbi:uncharacterized protein JCM6883_000065 [Sporobolomyces salmoneus]|uniref:uncharacterized protein n=1 Tax=Sporobolomyces salmoneus TaxID=183962 RepID=UPI00316BAA07